MGFYCVTLDRSDNPETEYFHSDLNLYDHNERMERWQSQRGNVRPVDSWVSCEMMYAIPDEVRYLLDSRFNAGIDHAAMCIAMVPMLPESMQQELTREYAQQIRYYKRALEHLSRYPAPKPDDSNQF